MDEEIKTEEEVVTPVVTEEEKVEESTEQDPLKTELEKVQRKGRTKVEKLQYTKKRIDEQLKELGVDDEPVDDEDEKPVTVGMLKKLQAQSATKTALDLTNDITDETERELTKYHLENTIKSTGNPQEDLKLAQNQVNAVKNAKILEEMGRKSGSKSGAGPGAPAKNQKPVEDFTPEELAFMKAPFNMSKAQILAARPK